MLSWAVTFLVIGLTAGVLGRIRRGGHCDPIAYVLFVVFPDSCGDQDGHGKRPPWREGEQGPHRPARTVLTIVLYSWRRRVLWSRRPPHRR